MIAEDNNNVSYF